MTKKAIVIGATSGIGLEVARLLAVRGYSVGIAGRRVERLQEIVATTDGIVAWQQIDVDSDDAPDGLHELIGRLGGMDLYFHSSGIGWGTARSMRRRRCARCRPMPLVLHEWCWRLTSGLPTTTTEDA